jgi:hypothetical protein
MNTDRQTDVIATTIYRGFETRECPGGIWGIYQNDTLVCTRESKQAALAWIEKRADEMGERQNWRRG